jgi:hypothetical protein
VTDDLPIEIRFRTSQGDAPLGPQGDEARALAFPGGKFASEIEFDARRWRFSHTELMQGPSDSEPTFKRLVYFEPPLK